MSSASASGPSPATAAAAAPVETDAATGATGPMTQPPKFLVDMKAKFCRMCGGRLELSTPPEGKEWRHVCQNPDCGYIDYQNPKMVVGCIVEHEGKVLLCKRAIQPCYGKWTLPAGYMEWNESSAAGAARETWEEAHAQVSVIAPYAHWDIPMIGQAYILFRASLAPPYTFSSGPESLEVALFEPSAIPFEELAFSSVSTTLRLYLEDLRTGSFRFHHGVIDKRPGSLPNDPGAFVVRDHMALSVDLAGPSGGADTATQQ
ncbi:hypothetical protein HYH03_009397 [Edaphochlamys debaryana]|uniref:Nudix hydrolase domain-containing protein n=1 Tax=Edaphochlamys debaryana TaxID=47281 RepID=A0A835Y1P5_9CHLO|nr:hypothetical protein HYH03_009397 [Edaphochlamys debaryana]|eukprot:KAG2492456.1 hypothetical protein HYH03_009397 [Edaphochlamys debaryana]